MKKNESAKVTDSTIVVDEQGNVVPGKNLPVVDEQGNIVPVENSLAVNAQKNLAPGVKIPDAETVKELFKPLTNVPEIMKENNSNTKEIAEKGLDKVVEIAKLGIDKPEAELFLNEQADRIERIVQGAYENSKDNNDAANGIAEEYSFSIAMTVITIAAVFGCAALGLKYPDVAAKLAKSLFNLPRK